MAKKQRVSFVEGVLSVEYPTLGKTFKADTTKYPKVILACAMAHGFKQKFGDAASGQSPAEKYQEVQAIHASLLAGEWERTASIDLTPLICQAVARIKSLKLSDVEKCAKEDPETVKTWGAKLAVKAEIAKIRAENAAARAEEADEEEIEIDLS